MKLVKHCKFESHFVFGRFIIILLFAFALISGCGFHAAKDDFEEAPLNKYFTEKERQQLSKIVEFMDSIVFSHYTASDEVIAYINFYDSICEASEEESFEGFFIEEQLKFSFLFALDTALFEKIWTKFTPKEVRTKDTILYNPVNFISVDLHHSGEYVMFLCELGQSNTYFKSVCESIERCGGICPTIYGGFYSKMYDFDFYQFNDRLWFAVVLLTMEEPLEMKIERYLQKEN
jgi:hypothetical protein